MTNNKNKFSGFIRAVLTVTFLISSPSADASFSTIKNAFSLIDTTCLLSSKQYQELARFKQQITAAKSLGEARTLALTPTEDALNALKNARTIMPFSDDLRAAENKLHDKKQRIILASSQEQVADEFDGMMLASLDNDRAAHVNIGSGSCNYSTGELIAIVVGLILGIIPGIILLVVLC